MPQPRDVLVLAIDGCQSLDVFGPVEVFSFAFGEVPGSYRVQVVGPTDGEGITMSNGVRLGVAPLPEPPEPHDTLLVAGGAGARAEVQDAAVVDWVARAAAQAKRTTAVCTGAYLLGNEGNDRVGGSSGNDRAGGQSGRDTVNGDSGNDRVNGGSGRDCLSGGGGNDSISARDRTRDTVNCGSGRDSVSAV